MDKSLVEVSEIEGSDSEISDWGTSVVILVDPWEVCPSWVTNGAMLVVFAAAGEVAWTASFVAARPGISRGGST